MDVDEFKDQLDTLGVNLTEAEKSQMFRNMDEDGSGELDYVEFLQLLGDMDSNASTKDLVPVREEWVKRAANVIQHMKRKEMMVSSMTNYLMTQAKCTKEEIHRAYNEVTIRRGIPNLKDQFSVLQDDMAKDNEMQKIYQWTSFLGPNSPNCKYDSFQSSLHEMHTNIRIRSITCWHDKENNTFNGFQLQYVDSRKKPWETKEFHKYTTDSEKQTSMELKKSQVVKKVDVFHNKRIITGLAITISGHKKARHFGSCKGKAIKKIGSFKVPKGAAIIGFDWCYNRQGLLTQLLCSAIKIR